MPRHDPMPRCFELEAAFADLLAEDPESARAFLDDSDSADAVADLHSAVASTVRERGGWR